MLNQRNAFGSVKSTVRATLCIAALMGVGTANATAPLASACNLVSAPEEDFAMQVPFEVIDGRIYVQALVNGRGPFSFAVDTGASGQGRADTSLVSALDLKIEQPTANSDGVKTTEVDMTKFGSLDVGGLSRENVQVITRDYNSKMSPEAAFAGIIAREFFADGLLIIDYPKRTISFSRKLSLSPSQDGVLTYERPFRVPVSIAGVHTEGNLDTGADVAFVLPQSLFEKVGGTTLQQAGQGQLANSKIETQRSTVHGPFQIGRASLWDAEVRVSERYPEVLVGAHALQNFAVLIDQRSKSVAICQ
jgi:hypothetical protein